MPPEEERTLIALEATPSWHGVRPRKYPRQLHDIRGPELVNNQLIQKQYGIMVCHLSDLCEKQLESSDLL